MPPTSQMSMSSDDDEVAPQLPLGDWRAYRARLIANGLKTTKSESGEEGEEGEEEPLPPPRPGSERGTSSFDRELQRNRVITAPNRQLQLPGGRVRDVWAHALAVPERGGLLLATPALSSALLLGGGRSPTGTASRSSKTSAMMAQVHRSPQICVTYVEEREIKRCVCLYVMLCRSARLNMLSCCSLRLLGSF